MNLNKEFYCVFQPKQTAPWQGRRRFFVSPNRLRLYIGRENANKAIQRAIRSQADRTRVKFRKFGTVDFYVK